MGNSKSSALSKEILEELKLNTKYSEEELATWYQSFLKECPSGRISKEQFEGIYASFFPDADSTDYARHVFRSFDTNADGTLDFKEYIIALHLTSSGKTTRKLEWAFSLYDVDGNGTISKNEVQEIVKVRGIRQKEIRLKCWLQIMRLVLVGKSVFRQFCLYVKNLHYKRHHCLLKKVYLIASARS